jgi:hypothetical protein
MHYLENILAFVLAFVLTHQLRRGDRYSTAVASHQIPRERHRLAYVGWRTAGGTAERGRRAVLI